MVVSDLDLLRTDIGPDEADAKLVLDSNAELPLAVTAQPLKTVARRPLLHQTGMTFAVEPRTASSALMS